jgi:hypothetical protein
MYNQIYLSISFTPFNIFIETPLHYLNVKSFIKIIHIQGNIQNIMCI